MKCLDTNAVIAVLNDRPAGARGRLAQELASGERIGIPAVALFELIYGYEKSAQRGGATLSAHAGCRTAGI